MTNHAADVLSSKLALGIGLFMAATSVVLVNSDSVDVMGFVWYAIQTDTQLVTFSVQSTLAILTALTSLVIAVAVITKAIKPLFKKGK